MTDIDLIDNEEVNVNIRYGERDNLLFKSIDEKAKLKVVSGETIWEWISENRMLLIVLILALVAVYYMHSRQKKLIKHIKKRKQDEE